MELDVTKVQDFYGYYNGKVIHQFLIKGAGWYPEIRNLTCYVEAERSIDSIINDLIELKEKGITYLDEDFSYDISEPQESFNERLMKYEEKVKTIKEYYEKAFMICHLTSVGDFDKANEIMHELKKSLNFVSFEGKE